MMAEYKKGFISPTVCLDGEDSHDWRDDVMLEEGVEYKIRVCNKCGFWS